MICNVNQTIKKELYRSGNKNFRLIIERFVKIRDTKLIQRSNSRSNSNWISDKCPCLIHLILRPEFTNRTFSMAGMALVII